MRHVVEEPCLRAHGTYDRWEVLSSFRGINLVCHTANAVHFRWIARKLEMTERGINDPKEWVASGTVARAAAAISAFNPRRKLQFESSPEVPCECIDPKKKLRAFD